MNIGIVPQYLDKLGENRLFEFHSYDPFQAYGTDRIGFHALKRRFKRGGIALDTIDCLEISSLDAVIFIDMNFDYLDRLISLKDPPALVYLMREPPSVRFYNSAANLPRYTAHFDAILSWNGSLTSVGDRFIGYNIPQYLKRERDGTRSFDSRKLLVNVTSRKYSTHPDELYSAREKVIDYFDRFPDEFTLYGRYWNSRPRLEDVYHHRKLRTTTYQTYEGLVDDKLSAYHRHRFALCFENMTGIDGYVTEKIFDCLRAGTVPVYWGAEDIEEYVPRDAFVDYRRFGSPAALHEYLSSVDEAQHRAYLDVADEFLDGAPDHVSPETYAETVYEATREGVTSDRTRPLTTDLKNEIAVRGRLERLEKRPKTMSNPERLRAIGRLPVSNPSLVAEYPSAIINGVSSLVSGR